MFCENCGMEIEKTRFCPGCGAEQKSIVTATSIPVSAAVSSTPASEAPAPEAPEGASIPAASVPVSAPIASAPESAPASVPAASAASQPSSVPSIEQSAPSTVVPTSVPISVPMGVSSSPTVVITDERKRNANERKYTGGHIALCLITAAVMAGIAGMFAGLYFSLLWAIK